MKTYSESVGEAPFNWNKFLNKRKYTLEELNSAREKACQWTTCACGNQCEIIPRRYDMIHSTGEPKDDQLKKLGIRFYNDIVVLIDYVHIKRGVKLLQAQAKETLQLIEQRSQELIDQLTKYTTFENEEFIFKLKETNEVLVRADTAKGRQFVAITSDGLRTDYPTVIIFQIAWDNPEWFSDEFKQQVGERLRSVD